MYLSPPHENTLIAFSDNVSFPKFWKLLMFEEFDVLACGRDTAEWFCLEGSEGCFCQKMLNVYTTISPLGWHICFFRDWQKCSYNSNILSPELLEKENKPQSWSLSPPGEKRLPDITSTSNSTNPTPVHRTGQPTGKLGASRTPL